MTTYITTTICVLTSRWRRQLSSQTASSASIYVYVLLYCYLYICVLTTEAVCWYVSAYYYYICVFAYICVRALLLYMCTYHYIATTIATTTYVSFTTELLFVFSSGWFGPRCFAVARWTVRFKSWKTATSRCSYLSGLFSSGQLRLAQVV